MFFDKKDSATSSYHTMPHSHGLEVLCDEVQVVNMGARDEKLMNSSLLW